MSAGIEKGIKYCQDQSSIMILFEHNFTHNVAVFKATLKSIMLKFSSIIHLTLVCNMLWYKNKERLIRLAMEDFSFPLPLSWTFKDVAVHRRIDGCR